jgi:hypothetical protein
MKSDYRVIDLTTNQLLLKTDDYESVLVFLVKCVPYNKYKHIILKDTHKIDLLELITFKRERDRILEKGIKYNQNYHRSDAKYDYIDKLLNDLEK